MCDSFHSFGFYRNFVYFSFQFNFANGAAVVVALNVYTPHLNSPIAHFSFSHLFIAHFLSLYLATNGFGYVLAKCQDLIWRVYALHGTYGRRWSQHTHKHTINVLYNRRALIVCHVARTLCVCVRFDREMHSEWSAHFNIYPIRFSRFPLFLLFVQKFQFVRLAVVHVAFIICAKRQMLRLLLMFAGCCV